MLSSNSSSCNHNGITSFTSKSQQDPNFFFSFPNSPHDIHLQYDDIPYLDHLLDSFYHHQSLHTNTPATEWNENAAAVSVPTSAAAVRKDRHSKINTARGPRDRRMRLSLDIARKFFDLQDLLGYDKASRTVDWLLRSSGTAIRELARASSSCTSEDCGEAVSSSTTDKMSAAVEASSCTKIINCGSVKRGRVQAQQKRASVGRESRKKARERARERTSQKRRLMRENSNAAAAASAATVHVFEESHRFAMPAGEDLSSDEARISGATNDGAFFFNNHNNNAFCLHQEEQIAEFQFNGKPWEAYNSFNLSG